MPLSGRNGESHGCRRHNRPYNTSNVDVRLLSQKRILMDQASAGF